MRVCELGGCRTEFVQRLSQIGRILSGICQGFLSVPLGHLDCACPCGSALSYDLAIRRVIVSMGVTGVDGVVRFSYFLNISSCITLAEIRRGAEGLRRRKSAMASGAVMFSSGSHKFSSGPYPLKLTR